MEDYQQMTLWDFIYQEKHIDKPIRLIELFSGIGAQYKALKRLTDKALKRLTDNVESYKTCEWAIPSIAAYNAIHIKDTTDYSKDLTKEELIAYLDGNISSNYDNPCNVRKLKESKLREIYNNCIATHNLMNIMKIKGKDLQIVDTDKYEYIMTYSFPCQDLSLAGKRAGMSISQSDGGTRSGLLWEVERILTELSTERDSMPQILLMENVPEVIGSKNIRDFQKWESFLTNLGYKNYVEILNAKDYGIPQNRKRCYMVSLLGEYTYHFPSKIKLTKKLKDILEKNVDEKFFLSKKMIEYISATNDKWTGNNSGAIVNRDIAVTLNTAPGQRRCDASDYITDDLPDNTDLRGCKQIASLNYYNHDQSNRVYDISGISPTIRTGYDDAKTIKVAVNKRLAETLENNKVEDADCIDAYNRNVKKDIVGTITTRVSESNMTFIAESVNYLETTNGHQSGNVYADDGLAPTLTACDYKSPIKIVTDEFVGTYQFSKSDKFMHGKNRAKSGKDIADTILTSPKEAVMIKNATKQGYLEASDGDGIDISTRMQHHRGNVQKGMAQTITTMGGENIGVLQNLRIRKLTPKECMRLMGFEDADYQAMVDAGLSNSAIYHCAGDSIVVTVLMAIFSSFIDNIDHKQVITDYVKGIIEKQRS